MHVRPTDAGLCVDSAKTLAVAGDRTSTRSRLVEAPDRPPGARARRHRRRDPRWRSSSTVSARTSTSTPRRAASASTPAAPRRSPRRTARILDRAGGGAERCRPRSSRSDTDIDLPLKTVSPTVTAAEVQRAMTEFADAGHVRPGHPGRRTEDASSSQPASFAPFLSMKADSAGTSSRWWTPRGCARPSTPRSAASCVEPKDAQVVLANGKPKIIPSRNGRTLEAAGLSVALLKVAAAERSAYGLRSPSPPARRPSPPPTPRRWGSRRSCRPSPSTSRTRRTACRTSGRPPGTSTAPCSSPATRSA